MTAHAKETVPSFEEPMAAMGPKKLVLCFDGTGNEFSGSNADTNVVKILHKLDGNSPNQLQYYQTGIGTYQVNDKSVNRTWLGEMHGTVHKKIDEAVGTSFDAHVMAGYEFLMRYHYPGDKIYMFGFSRGAFTAKFLSRMVNKVGLLCKGNTEMIPFALRLYARYLKNEVNDFEEAYNRRQAEKAAGLFVSDKDAPSTLPLTMKLLHDPGDLAGTSADHPEICTTNGRAYSSANGPADGSAGGTAPEARPKHGHAYEVANDEIAAFSNTFCRKERTSRCGEVAQENIKVYFLGMWDCVNSVAVLERKTPIPMPVKGTATFVRHAVAIDERRVKFKPALLAQDIRLPTSEHEDIKEVWFPGNHGDVGGGWPAVECEPDVKKQKTREDTSVWQRIKKACATSKKVYTTSKKVCATSKAAGPSHDVRKDPFQMSDLALAWMVRELEIVGERDPSSALEWLNSVNDFKQDFKDRIDQALGGFMHDTLKFGAGTGAFSVLFWKFMERFPLITRWELNKNEWDNVRFPLNGGGARDIPHDAVLHGSVDWRLHNDPTYHPRNNHGGNLPPCLKDKGKIARLCPVEEALEDTDRVHQTYTFPKTN